MKHSLEFEPIGSDEIMLLKVRAGRERDRLRNNLQLTFDQFLAKVSHVNRKYAALIDTVMRREVLNYATARQ